MDDVMMHIWSRLMRVSSHQSLVPMDCLAARGGADNSDSCEKNYTWAWTWPGGGGVIILSLSSCHD